MTGDMKLEFLIYGLCVVIALWYVFSRKPKKRTPAVADFPTHPKENDKLVIVDDVREEEMRKIAQEFCEMYNEREWRAVLRLTRLSETRYAVTFPYDADFEILCFFVNYANYPAGFDKRFHTVGQATMTPTDAGRAEDSVPKKVMLFVSDMDTEYDNVFVTTSDNVGYKFSFAMRGGKRLLDAPDRIYMKPPVEKKEIETLPYVEFK